MMTTHSKLPTLIKQSFDPFLLHRLRWSIKRLEDKIIPLAKKKIRPQDLGKMREFEKLKTQIREEYERKKAEETIYDEKIKNTSKRSYTPSTGATVRFKKFSI